jgi:hypothetical protein
MTRWLLLVAVQLSLACSSTQKPAAVSSSGAPKLPRSSIAALLARGEELQLTADQVRQLKELDDQLERQNAPLREAMNRRQSGEQSGGFRGYGGRSRGGMGGRSIARGSNAADDSHRPKSPQERMDDNDTAAYLEAEKLLTDAQRTQAREIASRYREELWNARHPAGDNSRG